MPEPIAFFGQRIEPGEVVPIDALSAFCITNIAFADGVKGSARAVVKVHHTQLPQLPDDSEDEEDEEEDEEEGEGDFEEQVLTVCHLHPGKIEQAQVNLHFSAHALIGVSVTGDNAVDLIGSYTTSADDDYDSDPDSDEEGYSSFDESDEEIDSDAVGSLPDLKRRIGGKVDAAGSDEEESLDEDELDIADLMDESEEDESAEEAEAAPTKSKKRSIAEVDADASMMTTASTADVSDSELAAAAAAEGLDISSLSKNQRKRLNKKLRTESGEAASPAVAEPAQDKKAAAAEKKAAAAADKKKAADEKAKAAAAKEAKSKKQKLPSGVEIEDKKIGTGPIAKAGQRVGMRYIGRLVSGKQFDANTSGKPFSFKLGRGEVIKGWDEGIKGMQVGGERRLTIPPASGYGRSGAPPAIPGNATLVFDIKMVDLK
ncbi:FKBP-like protein [Tilletiopsis washingtonensis]|uniref:FK506-binding protein n=1 Tax=Tilletiopsis washingtonensis TaxID=58919 RepID=A0A316ZAS0_9BASI|nr:FKBP-like protein [Tilletiopsis washingtonensis]PWN98639.1 FKBP-like protein [Tilletiopsis washingtonensis]